MKYIKKNGDSNQHKMCLLILFGHKIKFKYVCICVCICTL